MAWSLTSGQTTQHTQLTQILTCPTQYSTFYFRSYTEYIITYLDGKWWTKKLIADTRYMCLNLWQIRNETLAANNEKLNYIRERKYLLKQAHDIQQLKRPVSSYATLTTYVNERIERCISMAQQAINFDPDRAGGQRTIRTIAILPPRTPDNRTSENRPPDIRTP